MCSPLGTALVLASKKWMKLKGLPKTKHSSLFNRGDKWKKSFRTLTPFVKNKLKKTLLYIASPSCVHLLDRLLSLPVKNWMKLKGLPRTKQASLFSNEWKKFYNTDTMTITSSISAKYVTLWVTRILKMDTRGLYYNTLWFRNLQKTDRYSIKLVSCGLNKHASLSKQTHYLTTESIHYESIMPLGLALQKHYSFMIYGFCSKLACFY
jgi:hypothetical protein